MNTFIKFFAVAAAALFAVEATANQQVVRKNNYSTSRGENPYSYAQRQSAKPTPVKDMTTGAYFAFGVSKGLASWTNEYGIEVYDPIENKIKREFAKEALEYSPFGLSGALGFYNKNLRGEFEFNYIFPYSDRYIDVASDTYHSLELGSYSFMLNGYFDFGSRKWMVRPYIGVGAGMDIANVEQAIRTTAYVPELGIDVTATVPKGSHSASRLAGQAMLGLYGEVGNGVYIDIGYRLMMNSSIMLRQQIMWSNLPGVTGKYTTEFVSDPSHFLRLGLRFEI
jgi:opacity protein-like surface antigen